MKGQEPPLKRKKPETEASSNLPLPDDLVMSCLARVSRLHYLTLSLVSKNFQSLLASPELYRTRSLLGHTEKCLYVCLQFPPDPTPRWFTLYRKPDRTLTNRTTKKGKKENSSGNVLASIRIRNAPTVEWSNLVAVGPNLYAISGPIEGAPCSSFSFLDCRTHTWVESPSFRANGEPDGCIYLPGCYEDPDSLEVFNTKTQTWEPPGKRIFKPENMEGKFYMEFDGLCGKKGVAFNLKEMAMESVGSKMCIIQNIAYSHRSSGEFYWCDYFSSDYGGKLEGLEGLPKFSKYSNVKLFDYGGKLLVLWDKFVPARGGYKKKMIWCAVIKLERRNNKEVWGKVEWFDAVLTVPKCYEYVYAIAATL